MKHSITATLCFKLTFCVFVLYFTSSNIMWRTCSKGMLICNAKIVFFLTSFPLVILLLHMLTKFFHMQMILLKLFFLTQSRHGLIRFSEFFQNFYRKRKIVFVNFTVFRSREVNNCLWDNRYVQIYFFFFCFS